jgi:fructose-1,6-bisphosphatase/inositol monophosphatase family enzyme
LSGKRGFKTVDPERVARIFEEVAAEEVIPRFQDLAHHEISHKKRGEPVTVADVAAEKALSRRLTELLPGARVVGEEGTAEDPRQLDLLAGDDPVWVIDPIDGTGNFAAGRPCFAVMGALVVARRVAAAWIHDPINGRTAVAEHGGGAWMSGRRLKVAAPAELDEMRGALHAGQFASPEMARHIQERRGRLNTLRSLRCAGAEYLRLAGGESHFSLFTKMMPWDHAPGVLIHAEAGGHGRALDGAEYDPARRDTPGLLLAPDAKSWRELHTVLFG